MPKISIFFAIGGIVLVAACSSNNGVDSTGDNGASASIGGGTDQNNNGGSANGTSNNAGDTSANAGNGTVGGTNSVGGNGVTGTGGSTVCGQALCGPTSCGTIADFCGSVVDCGFTNCAQSICGGPDPTTGVAIPNVCPPCTPTDCATAGANCGDMSDGCGNVLHCGSCVAPACCGCGTAAAPGMPNVCGTGSGPGSGLTYTCVAGTKGCICDSIGTCAPGLTCDTSQSPKVCCSGTDCTPPNGGTSIGGTCTGTGTATCTPGITIPPASGNNDNCGYPTTSFNESTFICGIVASGGGQDPAQVQAYFNDEWPMTLGCSTAAYPVSSLATYPGGVYYPQTGDPACTDTSGRPMRPSLFITDITYDPNCRAGDMQTPGSQAYDPVAIFGDWTYATESGTNGTPVRQNNLAMNYWTLGTGSDPIPATVDSQCHCTGGPVGSASCPGSGRTGRGYGVEARYEAALVSGHSYRLQVVGHDGDQTQGADSGEACVIFCAGNGVCKPLTCTDYPGKCGVLSDGCTSTLNCPCCTPKTCEASCGIGSNGKPNCQTKKDATYAVDCPQSDGCSATIPCFCPIG